MTSSQTLPNVFGGLTEALSSFDSARALIWPIPFERTVSYGTGTKDGPRAIIDASKNMELYDDEFGREICDIGICTLPAEPIDVEPVRMDEILYSRTLQLLEHRKCICALGGEHSISGPIVRAHAQRFPNLSVLQIDAHADLRDTYDGSKFSHAAVMRRICEICPAVQVGIRSLSLEEAKVIPNLPTTIFYARDIVGRDGWHERVIDALSENVYLTFDVDGLDPSLIPDTGTPEPGGLLWYDTLALLRKVAKAKTIVGMDFVELCSGASSAPAFTIAKTIYKTLGYISLMR